MLLTHAWHVIEGWLGERVNEVCYAINVFNIEAAQPIQRPLIFSSYFSNADYFSPTMAMHSLLISFTLASKINQMQFNLNFK